MFKKFFSFFFALYLICVFGCGCTKKDENKEKLTPKSNITVISKKSENCELHLIKAKESTILINCAQKGNIKETVEFLKEKNAGKIDYLILTDFSENNLGGANVILRKLDVKNIIQPSYIPKNSRLYKTYNETLKFKTITPLCVKKDETIHIGDITLSFFGCDNTAYNNDSENCSLVFKITHFDNSFLFLGNIKEERLSQLTEKNITANFIKMPSKIKYSKALKAFIKKANPTHCYISCSKNAPANSEAIDFYKREDIQMYYSFKKDYKFISDGISLTIY